MSNSESHSQAYNEQQNAGWQKEIIVLPSPQWAVLSQWRTSQGTTEIALATCLGLVLKKTWVWNYLTLGVACGVGFSVDLFCSLPIFLCTETEEKNSDWSQSYSPAGSLTYMSILMSSSLLDINYFCFFPMRQCPVFEMMFLFPVLVISI